MFKKLQKKFRNLFEDKIIFMSCIFNLILCGCMAFIYADSGKDLVAGLYAIFFIFYVVSVFIGGRKVVPAMYILFVACTVQNTAYTNCTSFFVLIFIMWMFPKWKLPVLLGYFIEICIVCYRHDRTPIHLLAHFCFCTIFYFFADTVRNLVINHIYKDMSSPIEPLKLEEKEEVIIRQLAEGKLMKEIEDFSKNTKTKYLHSAMERNGCSTPEELTARYAILHKMNSHQ